MSRKLVIPVFMAMLAGSSLFVSESFAAQGNGACNKEAISCPGNPSMSGGGLETGWRGHGGHHGDGHGC